jgi:site-specific recombinase XerD
MATVRLKYVYPDKDRQGRPRWILRVPGRKAVTLKGVYGSPEFMASYRAATEGAEPTPKEGVGVVKAGSFGALALSYFNSGTFKGHRPETRRSQRGIINALVAKHGVKPWALVRREHVQAIVDDKAELPSAARNLLAVMRALGEHAIDIEWRKEGDNPAIGVKRPKIKGKGFRPWTEEHCSKYEATHPLGTRARLAYELLSCTALRRSDIVRVGRQHVRPLDQPVIVGPFKVTHEIDLGQQKTDEDVGGLLVLPPLQAAIDALPADNLTFIVSKDGKPLTRESFGNWFHDCCLEAGLTPEVCDASGRPKGLASHGLRKRMAKRLAHLGCGAEWIAAVLGHKDTRQVKVYTKGANKRRMARSALLALLEAEQPGTPDLHTPGHVSHTRPGRLANKGK